METSYNGWPASPDPDAIGVDYDACNGLFPGGLVAGDVAAVFEWLVARLQSIEPSDGYGCWGYNYRANVNNPTVLSCHSSGTAIDWVAPNHPNGGPPYGGWSDDQVAAIYGWLDQLQGAIQWGADYSGTKDPMHFEVIVDAATLAGVAATLPDTDQPEDDMPYTPEELTQYAASGFARGARTEVLAIGDGPQDEPTPLTLEQWCKVTNDRIWRLEQAAGQ